MRSVVWLRCPKETRTALQIAALEEHGNLRRTHCDEVSSDSLVCTWFKKVRNSCRNLQDRHRTALLREPGTRVRPFHRFR